MCPPSDTSSTPQEIFFGPLQFAYQPLLGMDDAVIYQLQQAHLHLDGVGGGENHVF